VMSEQVTNQSLRSRFQLPESKSAIVSQIIASTIEAGVIKPDETIGTSRKLARYLPFWALSLLSEVPRDTAAAALERQCCRHRYSANEGYGTDAKCRRQWGAGTGLFVETRSAVSRVEDPSARGHASSACEKQQ
jgi:hypothetical protein